MSLSAKDFRELKESIFVATDTATSFEMTKTMLGFKSAILVLKDWERWFEEGCNRDTPPEEVFKMINELEFLLEKSRDELEYQLHDITTRLKTAHTILKYPEI